MQRSSESIGVGDPGLRLPGPSRQYHDLVGTVADFDHCAVARRCRDVFECRGSAHLFAFIKRPRLFDDDALLDTSPAGFGCYLI
jgi:hypothetical protein